eukprot:COSAG06_NODE_21881_length_742_cov_0.925350_1_plen_135_part_00
MQKGVVRPTCGGSRLCAPSSQPKKTPTQLSPVRKTPVFGAIFIQMPSFYQDRLGTNIGNVEKKGSFSPFRLVGAAQRARIDTGALKNNNHLKFKTTTIFDFQSMKADPLPRQARDTHLETQHNMSRRAFSQQTN